MCRARRDRFNIKESHLSPNELDEGGESPYPPVFVNEVLSRERTLELL